MLSKSLGRESLYLSLTLCSAVFLCFLTLSSAATSADSVDGVSVIVPAACTFANITDTSHTATIQNGHLESDIGTTSFTTYCNDPSGFAIYAIGYSGDTYGNTDLIASNSSNPNIATGLTTSGTPSAWAMKLIPVTNTYTPTIENGYDEYSVVPTTYTKVASFNGVNDASIGSVVQTTYRVFAASGQAADTYTGKVRYTLVHPASEVPAQPQTTASGQICYYANASDAVGTMGCQNVSSSVMLLASNFSRTGYGFAGWSDAFDYQINENAHFYGPQETITLTPADYQSPNNGLSLYAVWAKSAGNLQDTTKVAELCGTGTNALTTAPTNGTANLDSVSALTDQRDNQTYAIAKLADGNCWMIENLRLQNTGTDNTNGSLAQGYGGQFVGLAAPETAWADNITTANSLYSTNGADSTINIGTSNARYRFPRYNNLNTPSNPANRPQSPTSNTFANDSTTVGMYSYGNYYTWAAAIADTAAYDSNNASVTNTSICPSGWRLPKGGQTTVNTTADFYLLGKAIMDNLEPDQNASGGNGYYSNSVTNTAGKTATDAFRSYPNNFVYSGYVYGGSAGGRGLYGSFWSSTALSSSDAYNLYLHSSSVNSGAYSNYRYSGRTVRCVVSGV